MKFITDDFLEASVVKQYLSYNEILGFEVIYIEDESNLFNYKENFITTIKNGDLIKSNKVFYIEKISSKNSAQTFIESLNLKIKEVDSLNKNRISSYKIYAVSSSVGGAGITVFTNALLNFLSLNNKVAKLDFMYRNLKFSDFSDMLMTVRCSKSNKPDIENIGENKYLIQGFRNLIDFPDMNYDDFIKLIEIYADYYSIDTFIIDTYNPLIQISKDIIKNADMSIVIRKSDVDDKIFYEYIRSLNQNTKAFINMVNGSLSKNELPYMKKSSTEYSGFDNRDYRLFLNQLSKHF